MMTIEEILHAFNHCEKRPPTEAITAALEQQAAITPSLLSILERVVAEPGSVKPGQMDHIFALYLLAKFRETRAFPLILSLAALPGELPEELLGDFITEGLARFMVSTFNGDLSGIKHLIENTQAYWWSRSMGLDSLIGLVAMNRLERETLIGYLRTWFHSPLTQDKNFTTALVNAASDLYPEELLPEIHQAFEQGQVDLDSIDQQRILEVLAQGKEACLLENVYKNNIHLPIEDIAVEDIGWTAGFHWAHGGRSELTDFMTLALSELPMGTRLH